LGLPRGARVRNSVILFMELLSSYCEHAPDLEIPWQQFIARPAEDGKSWSVFCEMECRQPFEMPDFSSEKAAQYWIDIASKS
jgi:hypothetical protein